VKKKDIIGKRFGKLIVKRYVGFIKATEKSNHKSSFWECICDCGKTKNISSGHLLRGAVVSCGCFRKEKIFEALFKDITGKRFGRLIAIRVVNKRNGGYIWECICDCGKVVNVAGNKLSFGHTKSCGCLLRDISSKRMKKLNKKQKGSNHPKWNPNKTDEDRKKKPKEFKIAIWRNKVYKRDLYSCQKCGDNKGHNLNSHHIYSWDKHPNLRHTVSNGITLCKECHKKFHKKYGYGNNTLIQMTKFLST